MKKVLSLLFFACTVFYSCSKDDKNGVNNSNYSTYVTMTGKIGDRTWGASSIDANVNKLSNGKLELVINGVQGYNNELLSLTLNNFTVVAKTYTIGNIPGNGETATARYQQDSTKSNATEGTVVVVYANREVVKGNYWFNTPSGIHAEGIFTVTPVYNY